MLDRAKQWWYRRHTSDGPMRRYLDAPLPSGSDDARTADYLALDLETTGLDPSTDAIVSVGYVPLSNGRIHLTGARHQFVRIDRSVEQSATIHHIVDADLDDARSERDVLDAVLDAMRGRVLLVHHAPVDAGFLRAACQRVYGVPLVARIVDTLDLARRRRDRSDHVVRDGELRLHALRAAYGLPRYPAHDALTDALSTAELFLAMLPHWSGNERLPLRTILR